MKKLKLLFSISTLCFALAVLCFGVFAATSVTYSVGGSITYKVEDVFVNITTKIYSSNAMAVSPDELKAFANQFVNDVPTKLNETYTVNQLTQYSNIYDFDSTTNTLDETNSYKPTNNNPLNLNFSSTTDEYSFYIVVNIKNLADSTIYTNVNLFSDNLTNVISNHTDSNLRIYKSEENGQSIVFAYSLQNKANGIDGIDFNFSLEMSSVEPYTSVSIKSRWGGLLSNYKASTYTQKLNSITITNNSADFDISGAVDQTSIEIDESQGSLMAYYIPHDTLFDVYIYSPVNVIYAPQDCYGLFSFWYGYDSTSISEDSYDIYWDVSNITSISLKSLDTSKSTNFYAMFSACSNLREILYLDKLNTSNVTNFSGMFYGCEKLEVLDISNFDFSKTNTENAMAMIGVNDEYLTMILGDYASSIVNAQTENEKIVALATVLDAMGIATGGEARATADHIFKTHINKIIGPKNLYGLTIALPLKENNTYTIQSNGQTTKLLVPCDTMIYTS